MKNINKLVELTTEKLTLNVFRYGCDTKNYKILNKLPATVKELQSELDNISKMPINKRLNELEKVGLLEREKYKGNVKPTPLTKNFLNLIEHLKKEIVNEVPKYLNKI